MQSRKDGEREMEGDIEGCQVKEEKEEEQIRINFL